MATCGSRIEHYKREGLTDEEAKAKVGLFYTACEACWPWPKYKEPTDNRMSMKRGIAVQNWRLNSASLFALAQSLYWGYVWHHKPSNWQGGPSLEEWERHGINFIPMVWGAGANHLDRAVEDGLPREKRALLGFNEPNFPEQANLSPQKAASLWPLVEELARNASINYIVSPAVNFAAYDPIQWLQEFFGNCTGCKVDAVAFHTYTCFGRYLKDHIEMYKIFQRPLWLTEFACCEASSLERLPAEGQMAYMREAIPLLERDESIEMYSWFSMFEDDWAFPIVDGKNGDAGLVYSNGTLSALGELYASFTGPHLVAPPSIAPQTTTLPPCRTSQVGEDCYDAVQWATTTGIVANPVSVKLRPVQDAAQQYVVKNATKTSSGHCIQEYLNIQSGTMASQHQALLKRFRNFFGRKTSTTIAHDLVSHCAAPTVTAAPWASTSLVSMASVMRLQ